MADRRIRIELGRSHQIKDLKVALQCLSKIGSDLLIEGFDDKLILTTINTAKSAFFAVTFYASFFDGYSVESPLDKVQSAVLLKHVLATFRTQKILSMSINVDAGQSKLIVTVTGDNRITKTYELDCMDSEVLNATVDKESYPTQVIAEAGELNRLLNSFQSSLDEVTIIANPERSASAASMHRCCQLQSFYDPEKGGRDNILHTSLAIDTQSVFLGYRHRSQESADVTFNVKDFRSIVTLSEHQGSNIMLRLDQTGMPIVAETHAPSLQPEASYRAELVLATLTESQLPAATALHEQQQQQQQQQQGQQQQQQQQGQQGQQLAGPAQDWTAGQQQGGGPAGGADEHATALGLPGGEPSPWQAHAELDEDEPYEPEDARPAHRAAGNAMEWDDPDPEQLPRTGQSPMPGLRPSSSHHYQAAPAGALQQGAHALQEHHHQPAQQQTTAQRYAAAGAAQLEEDVPGHSAQAAGHTADVPMQQPEAAYDNGAEYDDDDVLPATPDADDGLDQERGLLGPGFIAD